MSERIDLAPYVLFEVFLFIDLLLVIRLTYSLLLFDLQFMSDLGKSNRLDASVLFDIGSKVFIFFIEDVLPHCFSLS
jgi:hypothetical protein